ANPTKHTIARREFRKHTGLSGLPFILGVSFTNDAGGAITTLPAGELPLNGLTGDPLAGLADAPASVRITPYVIIEPTGKISIINPNPEMGQGTHQSIPALIA